MHFTPYQYRNVEQQFLQQFELRSWEFYDQNVNNQSLILYKNLINQMQSNRKETLKKKQRLRLIKQKNQETQFDPVIDNQKQQEKNDSKKEDDDFSNGFYITENIQPSIKKPIDSQRNLNIAVSQAKSVNSKMRQSAISLISRIIGSQTNQNLNLDSIQDRIYTQYNVLESLSHEQSQVQEAIFCFKRRISDLQEQLSAQNMKSKEVQRLYVQNNNEMMHVKYTNQEIKSAFSKTKNHFNLDYQGRKQIQQKCSESNKANFQQSIINHIYLQKMRKKIFQQDNQLVELKEKKQELDSKQQKYHSIYEKEQQFLKTYETITKIRPDDFTKDKIVSILDKEFNEFQELQNSKKPLKSSKSLKKINLKSKSSFNLHISSNQQQSLTKIVSSLIDLFKVMKHESVQKASQYKILISQREQKQKQLTKAFEKVDSVYNCFQQSTKPISVQDRTQLNKIIKRSNQIQQKCSFINTTTINIEQRLAFWLSKHLILMQTIMKSFLRHDKNSIKFFQNILKKTYEIPQLFKFLKRHKTQGNFQSEERQLHIEDSRNLLINAFENWQHYVEYLNILHESKYIQNFISQKKLLNFFKRIIKTKLLHKQIPTQLILEKAIQNIFQESKLYHLSKINKLLEIFKELFNYMQKVKNGEVKIHCTINYDSFPAVEPNTKQQKSNNVSQKQLIRSSTSKSRDSLKNQKSPSFSTNPMEKTQKGLYREQQMFHTFSSTQKHLQPNNPNYMSLMTRLKKRKQSGSVLNIHEFYQQMREEMQKVHKMTTH